MLQIHDQKRQIIEDIASAQNFIEFQRIKGNRLAVEQYQIAKMQIAVAAANMSVSAALAQQRGKGVQRGAALGVKPVNLCGVQQVIQFCKYPV